MTGISYLTTLFIEQRLEQYINQQIFHGQTDKTKILLALSSLLSESSPPDKLNFTNPVSKTFLKQLINQGLSSHRSLPSIIINPKTCTDIFCEGYPLRDIKALSQNSELLHGIYVYSVDDKNRLHPTYATQRSGFDYDSTKPSDIVYSTFDSKTLHPLKSISKSISSLIFGCAIKHNSSFNLLEYLNKNLTYFFKQFNPNIFKIFKTFKLRTDEQENLTKNLNQITLLNILTMTTQLNWNESDTRHLYSENRQLPAWIFPLLKPRYEHPGFHYSDGDSNLLSILIESLVNMPYSSFAKQYFFNPLGITDYTQRIFEHCSDHPTPNCSGGYSMCADDLAKIGQLILNNGSELSLDKYLNLALTQHIDLTNKSTLRDPEEPTFGSSGYGFFWHLSSITTSSGETRPIISASGIGGQKLYICKATKCIVITQGGFYRANNQTTRSLLYGQCSRALKANIDC